MGRTHRKTPVRDRILSYLQTLAEQKRRSGDTRLPSLRSLAMGLGVSYPTVQRVVAELAARGVLDTRQGSGIKVRSAPGSPQPTTLAPTLPSHRRIAEDLVRRILAGEWEDTPTLPVSKELRNTYGVSHRTIAAALAYLCSTGWLERGGRGYRIRPFSAEKGRRFIAIVLRGGPDGEVVYPTARSLDNFRNLEMQCTRVGVRLVLVTADPISGRWSFPDGNGWVLRKPYSHPGLLGYIVWTVAINDSMIAELSSLLSRTTLPVAVFHEGVATLPYRFLWPMTTRHFITAHSPQDGYAVGKFLLHLGHRRVGWLAQEQDAHWSAVRLVGLREAYKTAGLAEEVCEFPPAPPAPEPDVENVQWPALRDAICRGAVNNGVLADAYQAILHTLDSNAETLRVMLIRSSRHRGYTPLLETALDMSQRSGCTAWVAESDDLAVAALHFLRQRGVRIPQDLSLVGFDNGLPASELGLTSYSFNGAAYMHAMLRWVLGAAPSLPASARKPVEFGGFVVERATTGPPCHQVPN